MDYQEYVRQTMEMDSPVDAGSVKDAMGLDFKCYQCGENDWMLVKRGLQIDTLQCKHCGYRQHKLKWG